MIGERVREIAEICQGRLIDLLASGYNKKVLPYAWLALISGLADFEFSAEDPEPIPQRFQDDQSLEQTTEVVAKVKSNLRDYWSCLQHA